MILKSQKQITRINLNELKGTVPVQSVSVDYNCYGFKKYERTSNYSIYKVLGVAMFVIGMVFIFPHIMSIFQ